ncbi:hypothetical protein [Picosynechococcus sp. PCC 7117]|nr:hypothetical protein [Picosynechococcus sp. PCC 7117]
MRDKNDLRRSPTAIISPSLSVCVGDLWKTKGHPWNHGRRLWGRSPENFP